METRKRKVRSDKITFSRTDIIKIEKMAGLGLTIKQISSIFNISTDTLQRRAKENSFNLAAALTKGKSELESKLGNKAVELALAGNTSMIKYVLGCRFSWTEKQQIIIEEHESIDKLSDKQVFENSLKELSREELETLDKLSKQFIEFDLKVKNRKKIDTEKTLIQTNSKLS